MEIKAEYLLVLSPDGTVKLKANELKRIYNLRYGCSFSEGLTPHITLLNFVVSEKVSEAIINRIENATQSIKPFEVKIDGFDRFPSHTIYLKISSREEVLNIINELFDNLDGYLPKSAFCSEPHLTIAKKMSANQFEQAWLDWQNEKYTSSFLGNEMILLKRVLVEGSKYEAIKHFAFKGLEKNKPQLTLFNI